ncbi:secretory carrier-associated membrane protein 2-like isoform X3 [Hydractinia symbiolongicarpus]|uniref:secretory carrier-associated membrane protein 2-like isoform X3 n=1 Tax=Hydractinia symbiolongicarpus TaxID=13093 RepID=UPI00254CD158|nr:secretory carrier-associated membrane protein 2-like isoform X3 [Hydractinia symbiolongicarpus]
MSGEDVNPFADPNDVNPFAVFVPQQTYAAATPATIEPTKAEPPPSYSSGYRLQDDTMRMRQEELERKAAELEKKEQELKKIQGQVKVVNNFPPLPKFCCVQPCFYHDINTEIPIESQRTCRLFYYVWQLYVFSLCFNFICGFSAVIAGVNNGATLLGVSILYLVLFLPCSFVLWYRPIYKALKSDSSFNYMLFFFVFFFQILFTFLYSFGITQFGTAGWINSASALEKSKAVGAMFLICGALFLLLGICKVLLLRKVHAAYRRSGASLEKAQSEFATSVASNKAVQNAAKDAVVSGVTSGTRYS